MWHLGGRPASRAIASSSLRRPSLIPNAADQQVLNNNNSRRRRLPPPIISHSCLSTSTNAASNRGSLPRENHRESMQDATHRLLDRIATPLGSFRKSTTADILNVIQYWASRQPVRLRSATLADRLVRRFAVEVAVNNQKWQSTTYVIAELHETMRQRWLDIDGRIGAVNAEAALRGAVEEYFNGRSEVEPSVESFASTAEKWLRVREEEKDGDDDAVQQDTGEALDRAAGILLYLTECLEITDVAHRRQISNLFHIVLGRMEEQPLSESGQLLQQRMDQLSEEGWDMTMLDVPTDVDVVCNSHESAETGTAADAVCIERDEPEPSTSTATAPSSSGTSSSYLEDSLKQQFETITRRADATAVAKVEAIYRRFQRLSEERDTFVIDGAVYQNLLNYYIRARPQNVAQKAHDVLMSLDKDSKEGLSPPVDTSVYNGIMQLWAESDAGDQVSQRIQEVFECIAEPNAASLNILLSSQLKHDNKQGMKKALLAFYQMLDADAKAMDQRATFYHALFSAVKMKEELRLMAKCQSNGVDTQLWRELDNVAEDLCKMRSPDIAGRLIFRACTKGFKPDLPCMRKMIDTCLVRNDTESAAIILRSFVRLYRQNHTDVAPDGECFDAVLKSLFAKRNETNAKDLLYYFLDLHAAKAIEFSSDEVRAVLDRAFRSNRVEASAHLLKRLETMYDKGIDVALETPLYYHVMQAARSRNAVQSTFIKLLDRYKRTRDKRLRPDTASWQKYICSFAGKEDNREGADKAKEALDLMIEMYESDKDDSAKPDEACFNTVIVAYNQVGNDAALECADGLINEMERHGVLSAFAVGTQLRGYAKSKKSTYRAKAEDLFDRLKRSYKNGNQRAWPSTFTFSRLMETIINEGGTDVSARVLDLYDLMVEYDAKPSMYVNNHVLSACAKGAIEDEAIRLRALEFTTALLNKLKESNGPAPGAVVANMILYGHLLRLIKKLLPERPDEDKRNKLIQAAFKCCCRDGLLSAINLSAYREAAPSHVLDLEENEEPPKEWSRNVQY